MRQDKTAILMILDASGSMSPLVSDTIGGFNNFIQEQKRLPGEAEITVVLFNHHYDKLYTRDIKDVPPLTVADYRPKGNTALLDAVGTSISELGDRLAALPEEERPGKVIVVIVTDGEENSSREYRYAQIKEMVEHQQQKYGWEFLFFGANIDTITCGARIGIRSAAAKSYKATPSGTADAYQLISESVSSLRDKKN